MGVLLSQGLQTWQKLLTKLDQENIAMRPDCDNIVHCVNYPVVPDCTDGQLLLWRIQSLLLQYHS